MGSSLGPTLASIFMSFLEQRFIADCPLISSLFYIVVMLMILFACLKIDMILTSFLILLIVFIKI